jgi:hypothetical protein
MAMPDKWYNLRINRTDGTCVVYSYRSEMLRDNKAVILRKFSGVKSIDKWETSEPVGEPGW